MKDLLPLSLISNTELAKAERIVTCLRPGGWDVMQSDFAFKTPNSRALSLNLYTFTKSNATLQV